MDLRPPAECFMIFSGSWFGSLGASKSSHTTRFALPNWPRPRSSGGRTQPSLMTSLIIRITSRA
jgi:hypothetical protein